MRWLGFSLAVMTTAGAALGQTHAVKKPESVVRAVAVYEWVGPEGKATASRLVPVSVFINGELQDGGVYLARPVPFALGRGTIFELQKTGLPQGTLEISYVRHLQSSGDLTFDDGWLGYGAFKLAPKDTYVAGMQKGPVSQVLVNGVPAGSSASGGSGGTQRVDRSSAASGKVSASGSVGDDDDDDTSEPVLVRKPVTPDSTTQTASTATGGKVPDTTDSGDAADRPTLKRRTPDQEADATSTNGKPQKKKRTGDVASVRSVGSLNDDPDRPILHRGAPPGQLDEDSLPPLEGLPKDMQQMVAVSDSKDRPEHDFNRSWDSSTEKAEVLAKMEEAARARLEKYDALTGLAKPATPPPVAPAPTKTTSTSHRKAATPPPPPPPPPVTPLNDEQLKSFTLSYGGAATFVYTASAPAPKGAVQYVTVVAQREPDQTLKLALTSVTDSAHLDRTPWMRFIDVVDAEASNRASLLFELRAQNSRQFALYRVIGAAAEQSLVTGSNP